MSLYTKLAWRSVWRNWRRSLITMLAIFFATFLTVVMRGFQIGTYDDMINTSCETFPGYIQVQKEGFQDKQTLNKTFIYTDEIKKKISSVEKIKGFAPRIYGAGLIGHRENSVGTAILAMDPELETNVSTMHKKVKRGSYIHPDSTHNIVIGKLMLKNLQVQNATDIAIDESMIGDTLLVGKTSKDLDLKSMKIIDESMVGDSIKLSKKSVVIDDYWEFAEIDLNGETLIIDETYYGREFKVQILPFDIGDELVILASGYDGSMGNMKFRISGVFRTGKTEIDASVIYMHLDAAKELFSMNDRVSVVAVSIPDLLDLPVVEKSLKSVLEDQADLRVLNWEEIMPELKQSIEFDQSSGIFFILILLVIVAFGILNTVVMSITERFKEFGIMLALGTKQIMLVFIMFLETVFIAIMGVMAGNIGGYFFNDYFVSNPIEFTGEMATMYEELGYEPFMYSSVSPDIFVNVTITILIVAIVVYAYPAYRLSKLEPLKGIRYT